MSELRPPVVDNRLDRQDHINELCRPIVHREHRQIPQHNDDGTVTWIRQDHVTTHPPLLTQLYAAVEQSGSAEDGPRPAFGSKPSARLDAIDTAIRIDLAAARWVRDLGEDDDGETIACVLKLNGLAASAETCGKPKAKREHGKIVCCTLHTIEADIRQWWTWARVVTGWDSPAWKPRNPCPLCGTRGTLRIKLSANSAHCAACEGTWDEETIGLLAEQIRADNREDEPTEGDAA